MSRKRKGRNKKKISNDFFSLFILPYNFTSLTSYCDSHDKRGAVISIHLIETGSIFNTVTTVGKAYTKVSDAIITS